MSSEGWEVHCIGLFHTKFNQHLPPNIKAKVKELENWYKFITEQRHPTAHRIPPYIIPYIVFSDTNETDYTPHYIHAFDKSHPIPLHSQAICDVCAVIELIEALLKDMGINFDLT